MVFLKWVHNAIYRRPLNKVGWDKSLVPSGRIVRFALVATQWVLLHVSGVVNVFFEEKNVGSGY